LTTTTVATVVSRDGVNQTSLADVSVVAIVENFCVTVATIALNLRRSAIGRSDDVREIIAIQKKLKWISNISADDSEQPNTMTTKMTKAQLQDRVKELERHLRALENHNCGVESQILAFQEKNERDERYKRFLEKENRELKLRDAELLEYKKKEEESAKFRKEHGCPQQ